MSSPSFPGRLAARLGLAAVLILAILVAACELPGQVTTIGVGPYTVGSGVVTTEARTLPDFHAVSAGEGVTVTVRQGSLGVSVTAEDNLIDHVTTEVRDGTLVVDVAGSIQTHEPLAVTATAPTLDGLSASTGATIDTEDLDADTLRVVASTGASLRAGGRAGSLDLAADTGATADLRNLTATTATVEVTTGSTAHVSVSDRVSGACTGGSTLHVHGTPASVDVTTDAASSVQRD